MSLAAAKVGGGAKGLGYDCRHSTLRAMSQEPSFEWQGQEEQHGGNSRDGSTLGVSHAGCEIRDARVSDFVAQLTRAISRTRQGF